jgi:hypothetical protein
MAGRDRGVVFDVGDLTAEEFLEWWLEDTVKPSASHRKHAPLSGVRGQALRLVAELEDGGSAANRLLEGANLFFP